MKSVFSVFQFKIDSRADTGSVTDFRDVYIMQSAYLFEKEKDGFHGFDGDMNI